MNKKIAFAGIAALLLLVMAGCGEKPTAAPADNSGIAEPAVVNGAAGGNTVETPGADAGGESVPATAQPTAEATAPAATETPVPEKQSQSISVYYTDPQQLDLVTSEATVAFADDAEKYTEAFKALQSSGQEDLVALWSKIELKSLDFKDGRLTLDIHKPQEAQLGAGGESMAISALTRTMFQFSEVQSVELLVDGEQVESLMGHVDLEHPMTRENSGV
ncbi:GerMN domain-containing protein ['Paenibacillus yunnanensis' Narsing Rao et al. 2020]|uniref:GerMN domain-containing protein n=1 Tax=Paenibacillus tengchongensis TaxID=2608684 RepID=UPI00124D5D1A|nr:GerMN domain-containing protein [Paenibacillus tengchongensis]